MSSIRRFLEREDGLTATEYAVVLALIVGVVILGVTALGTNANSTFWTVNNAAAPQ